MPFAFRLPPYGGSPMFITSEYVSGAGGEASLYNNFFGNLAT